jgi:hypothetical protein
VMTAQAEPATLVIRSKSRSRTILLYYTRRKRPHAAKKVICPTRV